MSSSGEERGVVVAEPEPPRGNRSRFAFACAILASMTSIILGYDIGVMSGAAIFIKDDLKLSDVQLEILMGILNIYSIIGSGAAGRTSDWIGRRYTIVLAGAFFFCGALLMGFATNYPFIMVGRFVAGIGVGYAMMIAPVYTAEVAPASSRGFLSSFPEIFINIGILLGYVSNYFFSKLPEHLGWRFMLGIGAIPSVFLTIGVLAMPESPRWLVLQGRIGDAFKVLDKTSNTKEEAISRLNDIKHAAGIPDDMTDDVVVVPKKKTAGKGVWKDLLVRPTPAVRHILIACFGIHLAQQASGIDAVVLYSPTIFSKAGLRSKNDQLLATVAVGVVKTLFIVVGTCVVDRFGRRALLLTSMGGMFISLTALGTSLTVINRNPGQTMWAIGLSVTTVMSFVATFSIGAGPVTWVYCSEIFPVRLRAQGASLGVMLNRLMSGIIGMTFLSLSKGLTIGGAFLLFAGVAAAAWIFFFTFLPETRGVALEEIESLFGSYSANKKNNVTSKGKEVVDEL
ncbi:PREDICTED: putative polyol transporter 2 isoform X3 [Camelina sativa]|uniref:Polyol transporter 2 isoform X3 n=1 Tax=Camelina sativa TaxID=90675 RepID=A0ABM1QN19_CAMSA|nr:PREDICTED: putative polyol transporter 2 isoform X3 [Camelina sativa]